MLHPLSCPISLPLWRAGGTGFRLWGAPPPQRHNHLSAAAEDSRGSAAVSGGIPESLSYFSGKGLKKSVFTTVLFTH